MCYTNNNFVTKFDKVKDFPEEVILSLLPRDNLENPKVDILTTWPDGMLIKQKIVAIHCSSIVPELFQHNFYYMHALIHPCIW